MGQRLLMQVSTHRRQITYENREVRANNKQQSDISCRTGAAPGDGGVY